MADLSNWRRVRNSKSLPLFEWADQRRSIIHPPLLITRQLEKRFQLSGNMLNAWAEANGFTATEVDHDHQV